MKIKYIDYIEPKKAVGLVADVYDQMKRDFGQVVEPIALHSIIPQLLASNWSVLRETNVVEDKVNRTIKDAIATAVSKINRCPWCVDAHTIMLIGLRSRKVARAIVTEQLGLIKDTRMRSIIAWSLASRSPDAKIVNNPPFTFDEAPEIIGTAVYYHYINRMVSVLLDETPLPVKSSPFQGFMKDIAGFRFSTTLKRYKKAGESLQFIDSLKLDKDLFWASENKRVAATFAAHKRMVEKLAEKYMPTEVRILTLKTIEEWKGEDPGISRSWVERHILNSPELLKPVARLSLLAALSPYQIDDQIINSYKQFNPEDSALLATLSWASFATATRIGKWLSKPFNAHLESRQ